MKILYKFGPKAGTIDHAPRTQEIQVLINAGIIEVVDDTPEPPSAALLAQHTIAPHVEAGWRVENFQYGNERKLVIVNHDAVGGRTVYDGVPGPRLVWSAEKQERVWEPSSCPASVVAEFLQLSGREKEAAKFREDAAREARRNAEQASEGSKRGNALAVARLTYGGKQ